MKKILLSIICLTNFAFMQDECSEITNPEECYDMGCEWITLYEEIGNELIVTEGCFETNGDDWENDDSECYGLGYEECETLDFCEWLSDSPSGANGMCVEFNSDDWEDNQCFGLTQDECIDSEYCDWSVITTPNGVFEMCVESNGDDWWDNECSGLAYDECEALDFCEWLSDSPGGANGMCVEFNGDDNYWGDPCHEFETEDECSMVEGCEWFIDPSGEGVCFSLDDNDWWDTECFGLGYEECEALDFCEWISNSDDPTIWGMCVQIENDWEDGCNGIDDDGDGLIDEDCDDDEDWECSDLGYEDCQDIDYCEWISDSDNPNSWGSCVEMGDNNDCDPDLACATVITCYDGLLYPTSCGPENCDEPIGECDDNYDGCQSDDGQWYDIGHEMFINDCEYYECTENGWQGPFELDDCSDNNDWECSDLSYADCQDVDYCEWISDSDNPNSWGSCIEIGDNNDGPPECVMDCEGIENVSPSEEDATYFCSIGYLDNFSIRMCRRL